MKDEIKELRETLKQNTKLLSTKEDNEKLVNWATEMAKQLTPSE